MQLLRKFFPFSFTVKKDIVALIVNLVIYILVGAVVGAVTGFLGGIPLVGFIFRIVGSLISLYTTVGIILSILDYLKVLK